MSVPLSLRLCCMTVMAPALTTEPVGQAKIRLKGSPPPEIDTQLLVNGGGHCNTTKEVPQSLIDSGKLTIRKIIDLNSDLGKNARGLLKPIQGNGRRHTLYTVDTPVKHIEKGLKDLGYIQNLPGVLKQISEREQQNTVSDHLYHQRVGGKKMNQVSDAQNGTGKRIVRQNSIGTTTVNGHVNNQKLVSHKIHINRFPVPTVKHTDNTDPDKMCRSTESTIVTTHKATVSPSSSCSPSVSGFVAPVVHTGGNQKNFVVKTQDSVVHIATDGMKMQEKEELSLEDSSPKTEDLIRDSTRKAVLLEKRNQFLLRRLRRLQGKQLEVHVKSQLKNFTEYQHQNLQTVATKAIRPNVERDSSLFHSNDVKNLSTAALVNLVRKIQTSQSKMTVEQRLNKSKGVIAMDPSMSAESEKKSGHLRSNIKHWSSVVDSDATESSSGGESCDDSEDDEKLEQPPSTPLYKRAEWKWAVDRAAIVSRWTWLQAQVSDLEYRIRQQSEIHKTIRASKGGVTLGEMPPPQQYGSGDCSSGQKHEVSPVCNISSLLINVNRQASKLTQSLGNCYSPQSSSTLTSDKMGGAQSTPKSLNGYVDGSHSSLTSTPNTSHSLSTESYKVTSNIGPSGDCASTYSSPDLNQPLDITCQAARCRPLASYRKRKLLRTAGLHQVNHKAARLSSVRCQCYPPVMSCPMCGGRYNNFQRVDAEGMPVTEKVSLIDSSYHPVLSFPEEIPLPAHFEALLKSGEWQSVKSASKSTVRSIAAEKRRQKLLKDHARKNRKELTKTAAAALLTSAKLRNKYDGKSPCGTPKKRITTETKLRRKELKRRRAAQLAIAALKRNSRSASMPGSGDFDSLSYSSSPSPQMRDANGALSSSCPTGMLKELKDAAMRKKRFENAYDINNIVIPYSMAASTRVEKLNYKEIQTPKWRDLSVEELQGETMETEAVEEEEDISDEACLTRHNPYEADERKRFRSFVTYPPARRSRLSRESESMDAMSPLNPDLAGSAESQSLAASFTYTVTYAVPYGKEETRRRSGSASSRRESEDYMQNEIEPWPERTFPLQEDCYEEMKKEQLESLPKKRSYRRSKVVKLEDEMEFVSPPSVGPESPVPESPMQSGSSICDLDDPDWTETAETKSGSFKMSRR